MGMFDKLLTNLKSKHHDTKRTKIDDCHNHHCDDASLCNDSVCDESSGSCGRNLGEIDRQL